MRKPLKLLLLLRVLVTGHLLSRICGAQVSVGLGEGSSSMHLGPEQWASTAGVTESIKPGVLQDPEVISTVESGKQPVAEGSLHL